MLRRTESLISHENIPFGSLGPVFPYNFGQPKRVKNGAIVLKFGTLVDGMNIWRCFLFFERIFLFRPLGLLYGKLAPNPSAFFSFSLVQWRIDSEVLKGWS